MTCITQCAPTDLHAKMCSYWNTWRLEKCALIDLYYTMCSQWIALQNVLLFGYMEKCALLTCITQCAPTGMHGEMCSHWNTLQNVLLSTCLQKCAPDSEISQFGFTSTAKYTLVELQNEICIRFHSLAKCAPIDYTANTCAPIALNSKHLFFAVK